MTKPIYIHHTAVSNGEIEAPVTEWTDICHGDRKFIWIKFERTRSTTRHGLVDRKRPFVLVRGGRHDITSSKTLAGAIKLAEKLGYTLPEKTPRAAG